MSARLVDEDGERRLERVRQVADMRARAFHDLLVGLEERVELLLQRPDLGRQVPLEPGRLARPDVGQGSLHARQREKTEADLEQSGRKEAYASERKRQYEPVAGLGDFLLHLADVAGDDDGIALRLCAHAELVDSLAHAHELPVGAREIRPAGFILPGLYVVLARQRQVLAAEQGRAQGFGRLTVDQLAVQRLDLPKQVPIQGRVPAKRPAQLGGGNGSGDRLARRHR